MKLTIVIPAYNEESGIGPTLDSIPLDTLIRDGYEVEKLVVDNASTDKTAIIARKHGARVIYQPKKGYGNAYKMGFDNSTCDVIATGDADSTYPFDALPGILKRMRQDDLEFITTDRMTLLTPGVMSKSHRFGNSVLSVMLRLLFRFPIKDSQSGMWVFKSSVWQFLDVSHNGMPFSQEIKIEAYSKGFRCSEIPIAYRKRIGEVKLSFVDAWRTMSELVRKRVNVNKSRFQVQIED